MRCLLFSLFVVATGVGILAGATPSRAAETDLTYREINKNIASISLLDHGLAYSLDYDRSLNKWVALGLGTTFAGGGGDFVMLFHAYGLFYPVGGKHTSLFTSLGGSAATTNDGFFSSDTSEGSPFYGHAGVGVEYRKDFVFRFKVNALFFDGGYFVPWPGFTFGYAF